MATLSKKRKVINTLYNGNGITAKQAKSRFGVGNLRATMSDIRDTVEAFGNWEIVTEETATGSTRYYMEDTHPGNRTFGFNTDGSRYML
jgi:hypothetical protein